MSLPVRVPRLRPACARSTLKACTCPPLLPASSSFTARIPVTPHRHAHRPTEPPREVKRERQGRQ